MGDGRLIIAPPGWFADPIGHSGLRWWTGAEWTEYVAVSPEISPPNAPPSGSDPRSASPSVPLPGTFVAPQPETAVYLPFGGDRERSNTDGERYRLRGPITPTRWNTGGAWALSATPLIGVVAGIGIAFAVVVSVWLALVIALLPLLWMIAAATRDRSTLDGLGYERVPGLWWILLGPLGYLIARTVQVRRQSGHGSAPLWWCVGLLIVPSVLSVSARVLIAGLLHTA